MTVSYNCTWTHYVLIYIPIDTSDPGIYRPILRDLAICWSNNVCQSMISIWIYAFVAIGIIMDEKPLGERSCGPDHGCRSVHLDPN